MNTKPSRIANILPSGGSLTLKAVATHTTVLAVACSRCDRASGIAWARRSPDMDQGSDLALLRMLSFDGSKRPRPMRMIFAVWNRCDRAGRYSLPALITCHGPLFHPWTAAPAVGRLPTAHAPPSLRLHHQHQRISGRITPGGPSPRGPAAAPALPRQSSEAACQEGTGSQNRCRPHL